MALDKRPMVIYFARFRPNSRWNDTCAAIVGGLRESTEKNRENVVPIRVSTMKQSIWATVLLVALSVSAGATYLPHGILKESPDEQHQD